MYLYVNVFICVYKILNYMILNYITLHNIGIINANKDITHYICISVPALPAIVGMY